MFPKQEAIETRKLESELDKRHRIMRHLIANSYLHIAAILGSVPYWCNFKVATTQISQFQF